MNFSIRVAKLFDFLLIELFNFTSCSDAVNVLETEALSAIEDTLN